jgi:hypothetical protein
MLMVAGPSGKMLATPVPPLVIEIGPGGADADSVSIIRWPAGAASGGASKASPGVTISVLPTTVTGVFVGENTGTVVVIVGGLGPITCAFAPLEVARTSSAASRTAFRAPDCP